MDKYFLFYDQTILSTVVRFIIIIIIEVIMYLILKKHFKYWMEICVFIIFYICVSIIGDKIVSNTNRLFVRTKINSTVINRYEWKSSAYRCTLKSGIVFFGDVQVGDSIAKKAHTDSFYVYRKDPHNDVYQLMSRNRY